LEKIDFLFYPNSSESQQFSTGDYLELRQNILSLGAVAQALPEFNPKVGQSQNTFFKFDQLLSREILQIIPLGLFEASAPSVWSYITLKCLPDVANWRFPNFQDLPNYNRHLGGHRNVFRRIWYRSYIAGLNPELIDSITEDQAVALFERTSLTENPRIAHAILIAMAASREKTHSNSVYRDAMKRIRRLNAVKALDAYSDNDLQLALNQAFSEAEAADVYSSVLE
jgi:hypothetical protein